MTNSRRLLAVSLSAAALALPLALVPTEAKADTPCTITGFSPRSVEVGLTPKTATFRPTVSNCSLEGWDIEGEDFLFFVYDGAPQETFNPYTGDDAGAHDVIVTATNSDFETREKVFANGFTLKRNTTWDKFNASPEPVRRGSKITIKARLRVADWSNDEYDGFTNRPIIVEFRTKTGSYRQVKTTTTGAGGYLSTTVTAGGDGYWRVRYAGSTTAGADVTTGDFVDVR